MASTTPIGASPPREDTTSGATGDPPGVETPNKDSTRSRTQASSPAAQSSAGPRQPDNVEEWIWENGEWKILPENAVRGIGTGTAYKAWFHREEKWDTYYLAGEQAPYPEANTQSTSPDNNDPWRRWGQSPDARSEGRSEGEGSREWDGNYHRWEKDDKYRKRDGDIPEWDGKVMPRVNYFRKIDLWCETTGVPVEERAIRLLGKLTGEAFEKLDNVEPADLRRTDCIEYFKKLIDDAYEPIEDFRTGRVMDEFLDDFKRQNGQEIVDYNREWDKESKKAEKVAGELAKTWKAHLYVKKMRLTPELVSRLLSAAHGTWEVEPLKKAALITFPTVKGMFDRASHKKHGDKEKKD